MKKLFYILLTTLLLPHALHAQFFKNLNMKDGLTQPSVMCIHQDTLGRMWFGTREGVNIYDGKKMMNFRPTAATNEDDEYFVASHETKTIFSDRQGNIIIQSGQMLLLFDIYKQRLSRVHPENGVTTACSSIHKDVWYTFKDSLFLYSVKEQKVVYKRHTNIKKMSTMLQTDESTLYLGSEYGLYKLDLSSEKITTILADIDIRNIYFSSKEELWIGARNDGLYIMRKSGMVEKIPIAPGYVVSNQIRQIIEDKDKNIWFGTFKGLQLYDPYKKKYSVYKASDQSGALSHESVFSLYIDRQGTMWVGTYYGGVDYIYKERYINRYYSYNVLRDDCLNFPFVGDMVEDKNRNIWIATDGGGVNYLNRKTQKFTYYMAGKNSILHNNIKTLAYDKKRDQIYVGTHTGGLSRIDCKTGKVYNFLEEKNNPGPNHIIYHSGFYKDNLYVSANNGFWKFTPETGKFELLDNQHYYINFEIDKNGNAWLNSKWNIMIMNLSHPERIKLFEPLNDLKVKGIITNIRQTSNDVIYITTSGHGVYYFNQENGELKHLSHEEDHLLSNYCYNVIETSTGNILITTTNGVSIYSPVSRDVYSVESYVQNGISSITHECGLFMASDELIYIGGINGIISFYEKDLLFNYPVNPNKNLYFSRLKVNNSVIHPDDGSGILKQSLPFTDKLKLSASQNNITLEYSCSNYIIFLNNKSYQYRLEGFDNNWIQTNNTSVNYTNLPPGNYTFRIRERGNLVNFLESEEIAIPIEVLAPWYRTWIAYLMYLIVIGIIIYTIWHIRFSKEIFAITLANEKKEKERIEELNKMKLRFFTNISHELRTPLTLIAGQVEMLIQDRSITLSARRKIGRIYKNTIHMRNLITELLDFRKQDQGFLKLKVHEYDIVEFIHDIFLTFKDYALRRNIKYEFEGPENTPIEMWFDALQLQKAIFNLLSNAFKYTQEKGNITVRLKEVDNSIMIEVEDTGKGISDIDLKNIFDRFYLAGDIESHVTGRTGIGLALTKGIIEMHHGKIEVESEVGKGSIFRICLLKGNEHFTKEELSTEIHRPNPSLVLEEKFYETQMEMDTNNVENPSKSVEEDNETTKGNKPSMLIVEDDNDIIEMFEEIFSAMYIISKAHNGKEGLEMATELHPDIIVSDVMMPVMSGKEMCSKLKGSVETSHIPVVLLTAQTAEEQTLEGYMLGADDYITKPFNIRLLVARCNNLVNNRRTLMNKLKESTTVQTTPIANTASIALNAIDQKFIDQASSIIRANFDNSAFNMDVLAAEMNMGRSKLYTRVKEITGVTPNEFTLRLKLEEGKNLLVNSPELNISEISFKLGFSSLRYFSKCFKSFYGVTPLDFRKNTNS